MKVTNLMQILLLGTLTAACTSQAPKDGYLISGTIEGLPDSAYVQLMPVCHEKSDPIADTLAIGGKFTFIGKMEEPRAVLLTVKGAYGSRRLMLENTAIEIKGAVVSEDVNGTPSYSLDKLSVSGSPLTARYDSLMAVRGRMDSLFNANQQEHKALLDAIQEAYQAKDQAKVAELRASEAGKQMAEDEMRFFQTVDSVYRQTVMENKDTYWGPLLMISLTSYMNEGMRSWYEELSPAAQASYYGKLVKDELYPTGKIGDKMPEFMVKDASGKEITLQELCQGKKYILIDFWASWCNPCRKEIPNIKKLYAQYASEGFEVISISIDKKKTDWEKAVKEEQLKWPNFLDETGVAKLYKVRAVPTMYLIDAEGRMVGDNLRGEALAEKLADLFD